MRFVVALLTSATLACVDGTTPDCSYVDSGCFVGADTGSQADASDASSDVSPVDGADAATD
jgi:hypothetical protein